MESTIRAIGHTSNRALVVDRSPAIPPPRLMSAQSTEVDDLPVSMNEWMNLTIARVGSTRDISVIVDGVPFAGRSSQGRQRLHVVVGVDVGAGVAVSQRRVSGHLARGIHAEGVAPASAEIAEISSFAVAV